MNHIKAWRGHPLAPRFLSVLHGKDFADYRGARRAEGAAEQTVRAELALISSVFKIASRDWGMEGLRNPTKSITMPEGSRQRTRRLEVREEGRLLDELRKMPYMAEIASLAIESAMRQGELLALA